MGARWGARGSQASLRSGEDSRGSTLRSTLAGEAARFFAAVRDSEIGKRSPFWAMP